MLKDPSIIFIPPKKEQNTPQKNQSFQQQAPQNLYFQQPFYSPPAIQNYVYLYKPAIPQNDLVFFFDKPREKFDPKLYEAIDVQNIVAKGEMDKIEYYIARLIKAKLPYDNSLGSKGMTNAFTIMQLGAQYLLKLRQNGFLPFWKSPTENGDQQILQMNDMMIAQTNQQLGEMQEMITQLEMQVQRLTTEVRQRKKIAQDYKKKYLLVSKYKIQKEIKEARSQRRKHKKHHKKYNPEEELSEGQVPPEKMKDIALVNVKLPELTI